MIPYPFSAIVGQERARLALLLSAIHPALGGVLLRGERGTAKSTFVRGLAAILPEIDVIEGCRFGCDPSARHEWCAECEARGGGVGVRRRPRLQTLPLGVTEDRLVGSIDLEHALATGARRFEPGLLARAHRGVLYVDEVNLLEDHLVDVLLDVAATGENVVEREGIGLSHPARFVLVGTMNPEEGELRPQLLDRFGLVVEVASGEDPVERAEIVARRLAYERDPAAFAARFAQAEDELRAAIAAAQARVSSVEAGDAVCRAAALVSLGVGAQGHRADILVVKAAVALAALEGRPEVTPADLERVAPLVYPHRVQRSAFDDHTLAEAELTGAVREALASAGDHSGKKAPGRPPRA